MKKLLTLTLALFMSLSLIVLNVKDVKAEGTSNEPTCSDDATQNCTISNQVELVLWANSDHDITGTLKLSSVETPLELSDTIDVYKTKTLDLNGYTIKAITGLNNANMFNVNSGANLTITGSGTIDGNYTVGQTYSVRGFNVYNGGKLTIDGGTITKMYLYSESDDTYGAAIYNEGELVINDGTIEYCKADANGEYIAGSGGAISNYAEDGKTAILTINGGTIQNCSAHAGGAIYNNRNGDNSTTAKVIINGGTIQNCEASKYGGAIENVDGTVTIKDGLIKNCKSTGNDDYGGGAIDNYASGGKTATLTISGGTIKGCSAANVGGAIWNEENNEDGGNATLTITGGTIGGIAAGEECTAIYGGAIYNDTGATLNMLVGTGGTYGTIQYCKATNTDGNEGTGGAIYNDGSLTIEKATIANCSAAEFGGAIYDESENKTLDLKDVTISDCSATGSYATGAIDIQNDNAILNISGNTSISATSTSTGGAVAIAGKLIIADEATFEVKENGAGVALVAVTGLEPENCEIKGYNSISTTLQNAYRDASAYGLFKTADGNNAKYVIIKNITTPEPKPSPSKPVVKDESCEKVIGPTWHWNNTKGVCEEYATVGTATR